MLVLYRKNLRDNIFSCCCYSLLFFGIYGKSKAIGAMLLVPASLSNRIWAALMSLAFDGSASEMAVDMSAMVSFLVVLVSGFNNLDFGLDLL